MTKDAVSSSDASVADDAHEELEGLILEPSHEEGTEAFGFRERRALRMNPVFEHSLNGSKEATNESITVKLKKTNESGQYTLDTDDPELRALLKDGFERSKSGEIKKKRSRFSDLVFTQQFTAFDRQNPASSTSIFHGFFTLFW